MPLLWPSLLRDPVGVSGNFNNAIGMDGGPSFLLPPNVGGRWAHSEMNEYFPPRETTHLNRQEKKLKADWEIVAKVFPDKTLPEYTYYWLIVNTRSFYFDLLGGEPPENHVDRMVMCPFVDYFNHSDEGVSRSQAAVCVSC